MNNSSRSNSKLRYLRYSFYLIPVLIIIAGYGAITIATGESYPFTIVTGTSMQPTIMPGSIAMIEKVPFDQLKVGDVIVFTPQLAEIYQCDSAPSGSLTGEASVPCAVIHRIVRIDYNSQGQRVLETKGDNNIQSIPFIDTNINESMFIGEVVMQLPLAGYATETPYNEYLAIVILGILIGQVMWDRKQPSSKPKALEKTEKESTG